MQEHNELAHTDNDQTDTSSLQPMSFTDILDGMFSFYRRDFRLFFAIAAVYLVLGFPIDIISTYFVRATSSAGTSMMIMGFSLFFTGLVSIWLAAGLSYASALIYLNKEIAPGAALQHALRRFWTYLGSGILWSLVVGGLFITIIGIPFAIYFSVRWGLYLLPVLFEGATARNALRRSTELVKNSWWRVFGIMLSITLIAFMIMFILEASAGFLLSLLGIAETEAAEDAVDMIRRLFFPTTSEIGWFSYGIRRLVAMVIATLIMPLSPIGTTLLYFDLRIRKEAYDIEMQASE